MLFALAVGLVSGVVVGLLATRFLQELKKADDEDAL